MAKSIVPKVSVLMPVYNSEQYLSVAIESVLSQSFSEFELIVVNDGSTDDSEEILNFYANKDDRIVVLTQENAGVTAALNAGAKISKAQYIARMDADDVCEVDRLDKQYNYLVENPDVVAVGGNVLMIDARGWAIMNSSVKLDHSSIEYDNLHGITAISHPTLMVQKSALESAGWYDESIRYGQDLDLYLKLAEQGQLANLEDVVLKYRLHESSVGGAKRAAQLSFIKKAIENTCKRRGIDLPNLSHLYAEDNSQISNAEKWGWWSLKSKNIATARKYALLSILKHPSKGDCWRLLACSLRGY